MAQDQHGQRNVKDLDQRIPHQGNGILSSVVREEIVLLSPQTGNALALNASGRAIWELCNGKRTVAEIYQALSQRYASENGQLQTDLSATLAQLSEAGVLELAGPMALERKPIKFVVGIEDRVYFYWQLPILFESVRDKLPAGWEILVVVCNNHEPLSAELRHIFSTYDVRYFTGANHPRNQSLDFATGSDEYVPLNRIEALNIISDQVQDDEMVCLIETDMFVYNNLNLAVFPQTNALYKNWIIRQELFFSFGAETRGVDLKKLLEAIGCTTPFQPAGVTVFLTGQTLKNKKFIQDCFRFTQVLYLLGSIVKVPKVWVAEMPCFALALTANGLGYEVIESPEFSTTNHADETISPGSFYHYYHDIQDGGDGAFWGSGWSKQQFLTTDLLAKNLDPFSDAAKTDHERLFFELAKRAQRRLYDHSPSAY